GISKRGYGCQAAAVGIGERHAQFFDPGGEPADRPLRSPGAAALGAEYRPGAVEALIRAGLDVHLDADWVANGTFGVALGMQARGPACAEADGLVGRDVLAG